MFSSSRIRCVASAVVFPSYFHSCICWVYIVIGTANPLPKKLAAKKNYASNPLPKELENWYRRHLSMVRHSHYYQSIVHRRAARLLHHALHQVRENLKNKVYRMQNKQKISSAKEAHYAIKEPNLDTKDVCQGH